MSSRSFSLFSLSHSVHFFRAEGCDVTFIVVEVVLETFSVETIGRVARVYIVPVVLLALFSHPTSSYFVTLNNTSSTLCISQAHCKLFARRILCLSGAPVLLCLFRLMSHPLSIESSPLINFKRLSKHKHFRRCSQCRHL